MLSTLLFFFQNISSLQDNQDHEGPGDWDVKLGSWTMNACACWLDGLNQDVINIIVKEMWKWWKHTSADGSSGFLVSTLFGFIFCCNLWCGQPNHSPDLNLTTADSWDAEVNVLIFPREENTHCQWELQGYQSEFSSCVDLTLSNLPPLSLHLFFSSLKFTMGALLCLLKPCHSWWPQLCFYCKLA